MQKAEHAREVEVLQERGLSDPMLWRQCAAVSIQSQSLLEIRGEDGVLKRGSAVAEAAADTLAHNYEKLASTSNQALGAEFTDKALYAQEAYAASCLEEEVTVTEVSRYIANRKSKAPGEDGLTMAMLQSCGEDMMQLIADSMTEIFWTRKIPLDLKTLFKLPCRAPVQVALCNKGASTDHG